MRAIGYFTISTIYRSDNHKQEEIVKIFEEIKEKVCSRHLINLEVDPPKIRMYQKDRFGEYTHISWVCKIDWLNIDDFINYWNIIEKLEYSVVEGKRMIVPSFTMRVGQFLV